MKKITLAGLKSFIKNNKDNLYIKVNSDFDGMFDCVMSVESDWRKVDAGKIDFTDNHTLGICGAWLVGNSRDRIQIQDDGNLITVWNSCGDWEICRK